MRTWVDIIGGACVIGSASGLMMAYIAGQHDSQGVFVGRSMNIWLRLPFLLGLSALGDGIIYVAFPWASPLHDNLLSDIPAFLFLSIARLIFAGIIPIIYWAVRRFAREALNGVTTTWEILIGVIVWLQYWALYVRLH